MEIVGLTLAIIVIMFALGVAFFALMIRNTFRGGLLGRPWWIIAPSPVLFALAELADVAHHIGAYTAIIDYIHHAIETAFLAMMLYGFYLFYKVWRPTKGGKREAESR